MGNKETVLQLESRTEHGKRVQRLRRAGILPGILYGPGVEDLAVQVQEQSFNRAYRSAGMNTLITVQLPGSKRKVRAFIHQVQREPVFGKLLHVDFFVPNLAEKADFEVPVVLTGEAPAIRGGSGVLIHGVTHIKVRCLPTQVPHEVVVDVGRLEAIDDSIRVSDVSLPTGVEVLTHAEELLARVVAARLERAEVPAEEGAAEAPAPVAEQPVEATAPEGGAAPE